MKKMILLLFALILVLPLGNVAVAHAESSTAEFFVSANQAVLYQSPDLLSERLETLTHKTKVTVEIESGEPKIYTDGTNNFYKVTHVANTGYALTEFLVKSTETIETLPNFNAKTNAECIVYNKDGDSYSETSLTLERNQKLFLYEGYNSKLEYTAVSFVYDNEVVYGYIKTECIAPNGINPIILTCICLIVAILGIVFSWIFVKGRKKKKT